MNKLKLDKKVIFSYLISIIFIVLIIYLIDLKEVLKQILQFGVQAFIISLTISFSTFIFRGLRWKFLLKPFTEIKLKDSIKIMCIGFFSNNFLPARLGEFVRTYVLSKKQKISKTIAFSSVLVDRLVEMIILIILFGFLLILYPTISFQIQAIILFPITLFVIIFLLFFSSHKFVNILKPLVQKISFLKNRENFLEDFFSGGKAFRTGLKNQLIIFISGLISWILVWINFYFIAVNLGINISFIQIGLLLVLVMFVTLIPSAPGFIGTFEAAFAFYFTLIGLNAIQGITLAILIHLIDYITVFILGIYSFHSFELTPSKIIQLIQEKSDKLINKKKQ